MKNWLRSTKGKIVVIISIFLIIIFAGLIAYFLFNKEKEEELLMPLGIYRKVYNPKNIANQIIIVDARKCILSKKIGNNYEDLSIVSRCNYTVKGDIVTIKYILNNSSVSLETERCTLKEDTINCSWDFGSGFKLDKTFD